MRSNPRGENACVGPMTRARIEDINVIYVKERQAQVGLIFWAFFAHSLTFIPLVDTVPSSLPSVVLLLNGVFFFFKKKEMSIRALKCNGFPSSRLYFLALAPMVSHQ